MKVLLVTASCAEDEEQEQEASTSAASAPAAAAAKPAPEPEKQLSKKVRQAPGTHEIRVRLPATKSAARSLIPALHAGVPLQLLHLCSQHCQQHILQLAWQGLAEWHTA
jgi:hypothetical protein